MATKRILIFATILLLIALFLYLVVFHSGLSTNHEEWGSFGNYIGGIGGIVLSCSLFYYTYTIDKDHRKTKKNIQVLKLVEVVGESLACIQRWKNLNFKLANETSYERGSGEHERMEIERNQLEIKLRTNYKTTQILAKNLYGMEVPDVGELHETEHHFLKVFNRIKE